MYHIFISKRTLKKSTERRLRKKSNKVLLQIMNSESNIVRISQEQNTNMSIVAYQCIFLPVPVEITTLKTY